MKMERVGIVLAALMFAVPAWPDMQQDFEETTESEIVSSQRLADLQKFHAALGDSVQKQEPKALAFSPAGIDEAQIAEAPEGALWNSQSDLATGAMGIFNIEPTHGQILKSYPPPPDNPKDMAYDGEFLWCIDFLDDAIYKIDPNTGQILESISTPSGIPSGLTWDGENFWVSE